MRKRWNSNDKFFAAGCVGMAFMWLVYLVILGVVGYVAWHFISRYW